MALLVKNLLKICRLLAALLLLCYYSGCASISIIKPAPSLESKSRVVRKFAPLGEQERQKIKDEAKKSLGLSEIKAGHRTFRDDCSGAVRGIFAKAHVRLGGIIKDKNDNDVKAIYRYVKKYGKVIKSNPKAGDLVFFHNTFDRSKDGQMNDHLTHIGIVEKVDGDNVFFIHHLGRSIIRSPLNLAKPKLYRDPNTQAAINHMLRRAQGKYRGFSGAELFAGFGRL